MTRSIRRLFTLGRTLAIATLVLSPTIAVAQAPPGDHYTDDTSLPGGRRGERIRQVLDAVSSGGPARIDTLVKDAFGGRFREIPLEQHLRGQADFYDSSRGLDFYGVRRYAEPGPADRVVVIAKNRLTGGWQGLIPRRASPRRGPSRSPRRPASGGLASGGVLAGMLAVCPMQLPGHPRRPQAPAEKVVGDVTRSLRVTGPLRPAPTRSRR